MPTAITTIEEAIEFLTVHAKEVQRGIDTGHSICFVIGVTYGAWRRSMSDPGATGLLISSLEEYRKSTND